MAANIRTAGQSAGVQTVVDRDLLTVQEVAGYLRTNPATVRRWLREGEMAGVNLGGPAGWRVRREDVDRFIEGRRQGQRGRDVPGEYATVKSAAEALGHRMGDESVSARAAFGRCQRCRATVTVGETSGLDVNQCQHPCPGDIEAG